MNQKKEIMKHRWQTDDENQMSASLPLLSQFSLVSVQKRLRLFKSNSTNGGQEGGGTAVRLPHSGDDSFIQEEEERLRKSLRKDPEIASNRSESSFGSDIRRFGVGVGINVGPLGLNVRPLGLNVGPLGHLGHNVAPLGHLGYNVGPLGLLGLNVGPLGLHGLGLVTPIPPPRMPHAAVRVPVDAETVLVVVQVLPRIGNVSIAPPVHAQPVKVAVTPLPLVIHGSIIDSEDTRGYTHSVATHTHTH
eukprot:GHVU01216592.1.p1 GENE.GHVU01216592.1~~GHVU01216592.1.p1  ORF type:complete len:247 (-),score=17.15 GHVU01216592.1:25-765(-)